MQRCFGSCSGCWVSIRIKLILFLFNHRWLNDIWIPDWVTTYHSVRTEFNPFFILRRKRDSDWNAVEISLCNDTRNEIEIKIVCKIRIFIHLLKCTSAKIVHTKKDGQCMNMKRVSIWNEIFIYHNVSVVPSEVSFEIKTQSRFR